MKKRKFTIYPRTKEAVKNGLKTGKGTLSFKGKPMMVTEDATLAKEIEMDQGKTGTQEAFVVEDDRYSRYARNENGEVHNYFFGGLRKVGGGNERVKVKTKDGYTFVSAIDALEQGLEIVKKDKK